MVLYYLVEYMLLYLNIIWIHLIFDVFELFLQTLLWYFILISLAFHLNSSHVACSWSPPQRAVIDF